MQIHFYKYQGTGNDFILLDNREHTFDSLETEQIKLLCNRRFGVGADGLMLLQNSSQFDFEMTYFNSDGNESSMCGNGGRCITAFAKKLNIISNKAHFKAIDGEHFATINEKNIVELNMNDVNKIQSHETFFELNTGSPHYVHFTDYIHELDVKKEGELIRYSPRFKEEGINVNFVEKLKENKIFVRTYERGVEDETYSCGTGVVASAIAFKCENEGSHKIEIETLGGNLEVNFENVNQRQFIQIKLIGAATFVFLGDIEL